MFEGPCGRVFFHGRNHGFVAHNTAEHGEHHRGFAIGLKTIAPTRVVGAPHHGCLVFVAAYLTIVLAGSIEVIGFARSIGGRKDVHILVKAFVHPAVAGFVGAEHHGPPLVGGFMVGGALVTVDNHGVLHACTRSILQRKLRKGVGCPQR